MRRPELSPSPSFFRIDVAEAACAASQSTGHVQLYVDIIARYHADPKQIILVRPRRRPECWALPGGFIDQFEEAITAAQREMYEETSLILSNIVRFNSYKFLDSNKVIRGKTHVFIADVRGSPCGDDDVLEAGVFSLRELPPLLPAHAEIVVDYAASLRQVGNAPPPRELTADYSN